MTATKQPTPKYRKQKLATAATQRLEVAPQHIELVVQTPGIDDAINQLVATLLAYLNHDCQREKVRDAHEDRRLALAEAQQRLAEAEHALRVREFAIIADCQGEHATTTKN